LMKDKYVQYILDSLERLSGNRGKGKFHYQHGLLIGIIISLIYADSKNFDRIQRIFKKLERR